MGCLAICAGPERRSRARRLNASAEEQLGSHVRCRFPLHWFGRKKDWDNFALLEYNLPPTPQARQCQTWLRHGLMVGRWMPLGFAKPLLDMLAHASAASGSMGSRILRKPPGPCDAASCGPSEHEQPTAKHSLDDRASRCWQDR